MAYSTLADIKQAVSEAELIRQTDDAKTGLLDEDKVTTAIAQADAIIDSWCGSRYAVPFSTVPAMIVSVSVDIAIWLLFTRRDIVKLPESRTERYKAAMEFLKGVSAGKVMLPAESVTPGIFSPGGSSSANERCFTRESMRGF